MQLDIFADVNGTATDDVGGLAMLADDFAIAADGHGGDVVGAIEDGQYGLSRVLPRDDIDAAMRDELRHTAFGDNLIALSPMQQTAQPAEHAVFCSSAPFSGESIATVVPESAGEVLAHVAVALFFGSV